MDRVLKRNVAAKIAAINQVEVGLRLATAKIVLASLENLQARAAGAQTMEDVRDIMAFEVEVAKETVRTLIGQRAA